MENVKYEEENQIQPAWWYIAMSICCGILEAVFVYIIFFEAWFSFPKRQ